MKIENMYKLINNKTNSFDDFLKFVEFMILNKNNVESLNENDRNNFEYHFIRIPNYMNDMFMKLKGELVYDICKISIATNRLSEKINKFTNQKPYNEEEFKND